MYLSRVAIADRPAAAALRALIDPAPGPAGRLHDPERGRIMDAHHRLVWSLFAGPDETRDFLWRAEGRGRFLILSRRPPAADGAGLFDPPEVREFAPDLRAGDRLAFALRVNATQTRKTGKLRQNGKPATAHVDVVMDRLFPLIGQTQLRKEEVSERPLRRMDFAREAAAGWLVGQGARHGFRPEMRETEAGEEPDVDVADYSVVPLPDRAPRRGHRASVGGKDRAQFGVMDLTGHLIVTEPEPFLNKLAFGVKDGKNELSFGFGRAKAFGCGLMLIRRA